MDGGSKGCVGLPDGCIQEYFDTESNAIPRTCGVLLTWAAIGERNVYNLTGRPGNADATSGYVAMGLSDDSQMVSNLIKFSKNCKKFILVIINILGIRLRCRMLP